MKTKHSPEDRPKEGHPESLDFATVAGREMAWLEQYIEIRLPAYFKGISAAEAPTPPPPSYEPGAHAFGDLILRLKMKHEERLLLALALAPIVAPQILDIFLHHTAEREHLTEFGGIKGTTHRGFLPTGETALFLLAGTDLALRFSLLPLLEPEHCLYRENILRYQRPAENEPPQCGGLMIAPAFLRRMISGEEQKPDFSTDFPAKRLMTHLTWDDLVLTPDVMAQVVEINSWAKHGRTLLDEWGLGRRISTGYKVLFHGPPGTGKTLTACLLGQSQGVDVCRVDLSQVVSKYIGETEKNLAGVFDQATDKNWILFFDEADALFGQRTQTPQSNDCDANLGVACLLQRVEDFPGLVIFASHSRANLAPAFSRRLQGSIYFAPPDRTQRRRLWESAFPPGLTLEPEVQLEDLAREYEVTGGQIVNVVRYCALKAIERGPRVIHLKDIRCGLKRELGKEGRAG
ncbi:ATP-binding protein [Prosthecobacter sp.]|uniref:ATP-binding protein n=1 Tax=Prosthecobacter sp. TaxID=1965333 RepID=UPI003783F62B